MIDFYFWPTPNGQKVAIFLEEAELPYKLIPVDTRKGEQFEPAFLKISPNNKIPAIVDHDAEGGSLAVFESGAILLYLAEKIGRFLPRSSRARTEAIQWLMWQMSGFGPMLGQAHHFRLYAPEKIAYCIDRYTKEAGRLYAVLDRRLQDREFIVDEYSIVDMATWPWVAPRKLQGQDLANFPNVARWHETMKRRPGVRRGFGLLRDAANTSVDAEGWQNLFGANQYERRGAGAKTSEQAGQ